MLKWMATRKKHISQTGRSMVEMLGVLGVVGLLSIGGLWGIRLLYDKHKANNLLEDASMGLLLMEDRTEEEGEIELDFTPESDYEITGVILTREQGRVNFVRALQVGRRICDVIKKMEIEDLFIYTFNEEGGSLVELEECQEENEMFFTYTDCGEMAPGCFPGCGVNAHCVDLYECECNEGYIYNEETGNCEKEFPCGKERPETGPLELDKDCCLHWAFVWDEEKNKCACEEGNWDAFEGICRECAYTGGDCLENRGCCSHEDFCAFLNPEDGSHKGTGTCVPIETYGKQELAAFEKEFIRGSVPARAEMNWWTAQNWCLAQGYEPATRESIGCPGRGGDAQCTSDIWNSLMSGGWGITNYDTDKYGAWLEKSTASVGWTIYYRDGGVGGSYTTGDWGNLLSRVDNHYALCYKDMCAVGLYWDNINNQCISCNPSSPSEATTRKCCEMNGWRWKNGVCVCECDVGSYCDAATQKCVVCNPIVPSDAPEQKCCEYNGWTWQGDTCVCPGNTHFDTGTQKCECSGENLHKVPNYTADGKAGELEDMCCGEGYDTAVGGVCCDSSKPYCREVTYLESTGTQWIDTEIPEDIVYGIDVTFKITSLNGLQNYIVSGTATDFTFGLYKNQIKAYLYYRETTLISTYYPSMLTLDYDYNHFVMKNGQITLNGNSVRTYSNDAFSVSGDNNLTVFADPTPSGFSKMALKGLKIYTSGNALVRDFVPVLDNEGMAGLYDKVSGTVFYNSGSGKFLAGE